MAESRDNQTGRMLFTDLDVSDKKSPVPVTDEAATPSFFRSSLPTIEEIASQLELDFEDDGDSPAHMPGILKESAPGAGPFEAYPVAVAPDRSVVPESGGASGERAAHGHGAPRLAEAQPLTWKDVINSFQVHPDTGGTGGLLTGDAAAAPDSEPSSPEDDESVDILSALSDFVASMPPSGNWRGSRLGVPPPPSVPYGGIERVEDWYIPPEAAARSSGTSETRSRSTAPAHAGLPENAAPGREDVFSKPTRRFIKSEGAAAPDSRQVDMFSDIDLDALWDARVGETRGTQAPTASASTDTASINMFDNLDVESLWNEKHRHAPAGTGEERSSSGTDAETGTDAEKQRSDTVKYPSEAATTLILEPASLYGERDSSLPRGASPLFSEESAESEKTPAGKETTGSPAEGSKGGTNAAPPDILSTGENPSAATSDSADKPAVESKPRRVTLDDLLFEEDDASATNQAVTAPVVGNADIQEISRKRHTAVRPPQSVPKDETGFDASASASPELSDTDRQEKTAAFPAGRATAAAMRDEPAAAKGQTQEKTGGADGGNAPAAAEDDPLLPQSAPRRGLTTDDVVNEIGFDDIPGVNSNVSAPVIDDSAINTLKGSPKPGTEELQAIIERTNEAGEQPAADSVAVNPIDVFSNMDNMDFSDDKALDDDMRELLEDGEEEAPKAPEEKSATAPKNTAVNVNASTLAAFVGRAGQTCGSIFRRIFPESLRNKIAGLIAWHENWWLYLDLLAAIIISASLAVIFSYYLWYRA